MGCHPQGEATVADKAVNVCLCMSHEKLLAGSLFMNEDYCSLEATAGLG